MYRPPMTLAGEATADLRRLGGLAIPMIGTQIALVAMPWTDALVIARLGPSELAGGALAASMVSSALVLLSCLLGGLGPMTTTALGRMDVARASTLARAALLVALGVAVPLAGLVTIAEPLLIAVGQPTAVAHHAAELLQGASGSLIASPILLVLRHMLAARRRAHVVTVATTLAVPANAALDVVLGWGIDGWVPELGVRGVGLATSFVTVAMVVGIAWWARSDLPSRARPRLADARELVAMGLPIVLAVSLEVGVFLASSFVAGWLGAAELAAHTVAMQMTQLLFVAPNGLAQATAIHVAGSPDRQLSSRVSLTAALAGAGLAAATLGAVRALVADVYLAGATPDVRALAATLLAIVATFHVADALQVVAAGCLRGRGDTRTAMWTAGAAYAVVTPVTGAVGLALGVGVFAIWSGLAAGVVVAAIYLVRRALRAT